LPSLEVKGLVEGGGIITQNQNTSKIIIIITVATAMIAINRNMTREHSKTTFSSNLERKSAAGVNVMQETATIRKDNLERGMEIEKQRECFYR
tara:strand:+ start:616 stop:894 length:279 start_codon:yes stop_codon:yes gene_type:complete